MAKWKELGEVPDSDDESGFDSSQESEHELPQPLPLGDAGNSQGLAEGSPAAPKDQDIWDIPLSSQRSGKEIDEHNEDRSLTHSLPAPPPIAPSTTPSVAPPITAPVITESENAYRINSSPLSSPHPDPSDDPEISIPDPEIHGVELDEPELPEVASPPAISPEQYVSTVFEVEDISDEEGEDSAQGEVRLGRSLRPRKPIQEHPYLLESAQYSKALKSHGLRPLRVQLEEAARKKKQEDDSQEQEYEEESQSTAREFVLEDSEESQAIQRPSLLDDTDEEEVAPAASPSQPPSPERRRIQPETTLTSSQVDEEEFPDPADLDKWNLGTRPPTTTTKRRASPKVSEKRKLLKQNQPVRFAREVSSPVVADNVFDIPPSPPQTSPNLVNVTPANAIGRSKHVTTLTPKLSSTISSRNPSPAPANQSTSMIDLTMMEDEDDSSKEQGTDPSSESESESEDVRANMKRRMRGVLPASWLRLDQPTARQKNTKAPPQRSPDRSPERTQRKGVAQRRQITPKPGNTTALFLDDSDDDDMTLRINDLDELQSNEDSVIPIFEDDAGSVVEDDHIDYMLPGRKRASTHTDGLERPRKRRKNQQTTFKGQPGQSKRQQRITGLLSRTKSATAKPSAKRQSTQTHSLAGHRAKELSRTAARSPTPPRLSILDVVEPNAPPFIRIAARTASRRPDQGRSSPSRKQIALGTRKDNIDAVSVLRDWKRGRIQRRSSSNTTRKSKTDLPGPLHPLSHNSVVQLPKAISKPRPCQVVPSKRFSQNRQMDKQSSMDNFVSAEAETPSTNPQYSPTVSRLKHPPKHTRMAPAKSYNRTSRPAQLEMDGEQTGRHAFHARKRALDAIYRKSRRTLPNPASIALERLVGPVSTENHAHRPEDMSVRDDPQRIESAPAQRRPKLRKHFRPRQIDTTAPQYAHANDPLPREASPISPVVEVTHTSDSTGKLLGLGPFGTHYTQHFEIFPLDADVFFHESTILGSGRLTEALDEKSHGNLHRPRGRCTFTLDEKTLRWGQWDAQTSSEFGIVFDWIADYFQAGSPDIGSSLVPVQATEFVLDYLQHHLNVPDQESENHFIGRALEILKSFAQRLESLPSQAEDHSQTLIDVLSRSLIISLQILLICQNLNHPSEAFHLEEVLKRIAKWTASVLLRTELVDIRNLYNDLQRVSFRERGIRNEHHSMICWVILIRVLEEARIPRSGFWDVVSSVMLSADPGSISDAHTFERIWYDMFTLLPLGEFDNTGVLIHGIRHALPLEGWSLPQKLLKRVFQLYESNSRQAPSFNDYCRGIVSRCHYLVEQWGWRKSNGMIGTIFDFFAARGLSHLRNEEVYRSPEFLEHLAGSPSLVIVPEDRCFHIFLKLLALSIKRLQGHSLTKDVRNLVARVLPNHNRQYEKEKDIHESDLAALRNHHDLLCTLFWAAPASLRPSVQTIEKLVMPGSSHKEACLISLRAWSQLSRFVISSNEDNAAYKPFADWQKNIFHQVMDQYLSAESDIQQQLSRMSKDASRSISRDMMNAVVKMNRKSAMDVLYFSMKGFLGVIRHAPTLSAASLALNHYQLEQVFTRFPFASADFDWSSLRVALDIFDYYISRIEEFLNRGPVAADHSWHGEDAIMLLERKYAVIFFSMTRTIAGMGFQETDLGPTSDRAICIEQAITIAGRLAVRLVVARLSRVSQFFSAGKYSIFHDVSKSTGSPSRKYHALFLTILIERGVNDFKDLGGTILDLFLLELVKPYHFLAYENRLALAIKRHGDPYLKDAVIEVGNSPDYNSNRDLFGCTVVTMRKTLRHTEASRKPQLQSQFSKALRGTMDQMKLNLKSVKPDSPEHANYIEFVRSIITIIKSQDLCPVDSYFYQISREYSPSSQDPRLQKAGILSWGLKLEEGDTKAVSGLFYLLFPNFKLALANSKLADERLILKEGMENPHVFSFMLSSMFPAIIRTAVEKYYGWVLLDTYFGAFETLLTTPAIHRAIDGDDINGYLALLKAALGAVHYLKTIRDASELSYEHVFILIKMTRLLNLVSPSFYTHMFNDPTCLANLDIMEAIATFRTFAESTSEYLINLLDESTQTITLNSNRLFGLHLGTMRLSLEPNEHVKKFSNHMIQDINDNWISDGSTISVRGPSRPQGHTATQSGQGTKVPRWDARKLVQALNEQFQEWIYIHELPPPSLMTTFLAEIPSTITPKRVPFDEYFF